jgi:acetolactate synthase-1/2/3 large subunit
MNYAKIGEAMGCQGIRVEDPEDFAGAVKRGMSERTRPTIVDVVTTRDPARMLPAVDSRTQVIKKGDRIA